MCVDYKSEFVAVVKMYASGRLFSLTLCEWGMISFSFLRFTVIREKRTPNFNKDMKVINLCFFASSKNTSECVCS